MPGIVQVSVLDFKGISLPSPSPSPPSSIFIKVSMGKREYQTRDKGDFTFPLSTLRDNLIVTLQDAEGNEISHLGVQSLSIVEKGIWDDLFPLEGGGEVHMKLQFILTEDERSQIRSVRESALKKKKQGEVLNNNLRNPENASGVGDSVASPSPVNHEVSDIPSATSSQDLQISILHGKALGTGGEAKQAGPLSNPDTSYKDLQSNNGKEGTIKKQTIPNATARSEVSSSAMTSGIDVHQMSLVEKIKIKSPHADVLAAPIFQQDDSSMLGGSTPVVSVKNRPVLSKLEDNSIDKHEKQGPLRKSPSSVRKMISAFETSLVQERRPPIIQVSGKSQSTRAVKESPLKDQDLGHVTKEAESVSGRLKIPTELSSERLDNAAVSSSGSLENPAESMKLGDSVLPSTGGPKDTTKLHPAESSSGGRFRSPFLIGESQEVPPHNMKTGQHIDSDQEFGGIKPSPGTRQLMESSLSKVHPEKANANISSVAKSDHKEMEKERERSPEVSLMKSSSKPGEHKIPPDTIKTRKHDSFDKDFGDKKQLMESDALKYHSKGANASINSEQKSDHKEMKKERDCSSEGLMKSSTSKIATVLGQMEEKTSGGPQPSNFQKAQEDFTGHLVIEGEKEISSKSSAVYHQDEQYNYESSGAWIFPRDTRHLCITTRVNEHEMQCGSDPEMKKSENNSRKWRKSKPESLGDDAFTGPVKQAIKIAIVVGFGALVLFTRQREPRKSSRKANDPFFTNLE